MNKIGMMVDVSHIGVQTFWDVIHTTTKPVLASHSSVYSICPVPRNLNDDQIKAVAKNGGVIQINFGSTFLDSIVRKKNDINTKKLQSILKEKNLKASDLLAAPIAEQFKKDNPFVFADIATVADHIDHVVKLVGVDHVGIGSDFDGVQATTKDLATVADLPHLTEELLRRGYSETDIDKILGGNMLRVMAANESLNH